MNVKSESLIRFFVATFLIPFAISIGGCASMCGQGSSWRSICDERSRGNADLEAHTPSQNQMGEQEREQNSQQLQALRQQRADQHRAAEERAAERRQRTEIQYGSKFCRQPDLFSVVFMSNASIEEGCIYGLGAAPLKVLQVEENGILVVPTDIQLNPLDKIIFIKTKKSYVDGDLVQNIYLKSSGIFSYTNTLGAGKTIHAFRNLGDR